MLSWVDGGLKETPDREKRNPLALAMWRKSIGKSMFEMEYKVTMEAIAESMNLMQEQIDELGKKIEDLKR